MTDLLHSSAAATRAADSLLRTAGGRSVLLRIPTQATPGDAMEQLGLASPTFQDVELSPVLFRKSLSSVTGAGGAKWELLVSATAVNAVLGSLAFDAADVLFGQAYGVLVDDTLMEIEYATASQIFGKPYVYRLALQAPA